ncbi:MAG: tRNA (adenosine(37)-N6)-threonylcarbamoyltransferase complex ATPase subunit type 1 TsaE [Acidimicrobiaceae bacterium]|nr:tRNA (adenosine(37)-N6)-threonylcarbamoyltransferase complex ATPase subunit type 1 TsaE [Acidimicrobiaceae bacterium]
MIACSTAGVDETRALGAAVAAVVDTGDVVVLVGDLGAGKTAFVQGFAATLGVTAPVTSPTFTLANRYEGRLAVNHLDVYRFDCPEEVSDLALPEILDDGVTLVEWGDTISSALGAEHLSVTIRFGSGEDDRDFELRGQGETWWRRADRLRAALEPWALPC